MSVFNGGYVYLSIEWVNCVTILLYVCVCVCTCVCVSVRFRELDLMATLLATRMEDKMPT